MGGSNSKGSLSIVVNRPKNSGKFVAGSKLSGTVYARTGEKAGGVNLKLFLTGKENVRVRYTTQESYTSNGETRTRTVTRYSSSKRTIVEISIPVLEEKSDAVVEAGQYAYPFELQLPDYIPSSMYFDYNGGYCRVVYKIKAKITGSFGKAKDKSIIEVLAKPPSSSPLPYSVQPITEPIYTCCCFGNGDITFAAHIDDTRIGEGETATVSFACQNQSSKVIEWASAALVQGIYWKSSGHHQYSTNTITSQGFQLNDEMARLTKDEMKQMKNFDSISTDSRKSELYREILKTVTSKTNQVSIHIPSHAINSYNGQLIQVKHHLRIKIKTPTCSTDPKTKIDMAIVTPNYVANEYNTPLPSAPPDYNTPLISAPPPNYHAVGHNTPAIPSAPPCPIGWDETNTIIAPVLTNSGNVVFGGPVVTAEPVDDGGKAVYSYGPPVESVPGPTEPSLEALRTELRDRPNDKWTIEEKLKEPSWSILFRDLNPNEFVIILKEVDEFEQIEVAVLLASAIHQFTCQYLVAGLRSVSEWLRIRLVQKLLPLCVDVRENSNLILNELSYWEKINTEMDFENAKK